ncbi:MAG: hypothetical protein ABR501_06900 [Pyrinomonadaceae bacterium]
MSNVDRTNDRSEASVAKGLIAGLIGGVVASWTMNEFQAAWTKATEGFEKPHGAQSMQPSEGQKPDQGSPQDKESQDDATVKAARAISKGVFGHDLRESERRQQARQSITLLAPQPAYYTAPLRSFRQRLQREWVSLSVRLSG